ncbi:hypothetical protein ACJRPK_01590 [Aquimarina sp. 2-A2]|uniref:Ribbon-helix-helix CopG family protein n=1 Tax=Aquimarina intermedia TaxID=350814 RepID=A0A5S5CAA1_9FLAO|nr:hypothetical protein [Aquimarina intermedia]TYP76274.1 hypothetical protein BD809_102492 [Aquimarina intermedia]
MRKIIDVQDDLIPKLKLIAAIENSSVKKVIEEAVAFYIDYKRENRLQQLSAEQKEDLAFMFLLKDIEVTETITKEELFNS